MLHDYPVFRAELQVGRIDYVGDLHHLEQITEVDPKDKACLDLPKHFLHLESSLTLSVDPTV